MTRSQAIAGAARYFDEGGFRADLDRRIGIRTESQAADRAPLLDYLQREIGPSLARLGFELHLVPNPAAPDAPALIARRREGEGLPGVLCYGHGDVVLGAPERWRAGLDPWRITVEGDRWYGRGTADNKGQHSINIAAVEQVLQARGGRLGFNMAFLVETSEEIGSPGLDEICAANRDLLAADVLIASDGPRLDVGRPMIALGTRGVINFDLRLTLREGSHHSGNWGGLLPNPATILANAVAALVDARGAIRVPGLRPPPVPDSVRRALADVAIARDAEGAPLAEGWGEPGLSPAERVFGWNALEVLAFTAGTPDAPQNAIPPAARVHCQLRFVVGTDVSDLPGTVSAYLEITRLPRHRGQRIRHADAGDAAGPGGRLGALGRRLDRRHHRCCADGAAQCRRVAAERGLRRHARPGHGLGAALLWRLPPARPRRAPAGPAGS